LRLTPAGHPAPTPPNAAFNWGQRLGLDGPAGLLPLLAILLLLASAMFLIERRQALRAGRAPPGP
jgi:hypothetical protein